MNREFLKNQLVEHEGLRLTPYRCPAGKVTIGVGRNLEDLGISHAEAMHLLDNDINRCTVELDRNVAHWRTHGEAREVVLANMVFNLGLPRFLRFRKMLAALQERDYQKAADEMLDSLWARQVGNRSRVLAEMMRTGEYPK